MKFKVIWSDFAANELEKIYDYYYKKAGVKVAKKIIQEIILEPNKLIKNPNISQVEEFLLDREEIYRYLICKNYKIIYSVDAKKNLIKIADVFDTRQNPLKIKRTK